MKQNEVFEKPGGLLEEERNKYKETIQLLIKNWAKITSAAVVILSYIQYSYKYGICKLFHLPVSAVTISLTDYIPAVALVCATAVYLFDCFVSLKSQHNSEKMHFSLFRIICGTAITFMVLTLVLNDSSIKLLWLLLIAAVPPLILELFYRKMSIQSLRERIENKYQHRFETDAEDGVFYKHYIKPGLIGILIVILLIPCISESITSHKNVYETCTFEEESYAVILNSSAGVWVQPAVIGEDSLIIYTRSYKYVSKADIEKFEFRKFDRVTITDGKKDQ